MSISDVRENIVQVTMSQAFPQIQIINYNNLLKTNFIYSCLTKTHQEIVKLNLQFYNISYIQ